MQAPQTPQAPQAERDPCAAARELDWLDATTELRIGIFQNGHAGLTERHADLVRNEDAFVGVLTATHRERPGAAIEKAAREVRVETRDVIALLNAFRDGAMATARPSPGPDVISSDTSSTLIVVLDVVAPREHAPGERVARRHAQFFVDDGQDNPQPWQLRGCERAITFGAQKMVTQAFATFLQRLGSP